MKKYIVMALLGWLMVGCGGDEGDGSSGVSEEAAVDSLAEIEAVEARLNQASDILISRFVSNVQGKLRTALQSGSMSSALEICPSASADIPENVPTDGWSIRRASEKYRNPDHRVTMAEKEILAKFADAMNAPNYITEWEETDSLSVYHYYQPIHVLPPCLKCHGNMQTLAPGVLSIIKRRYPTDKATGYNSGDLRGMFIVDVVWPEGEHFANLLLTDSLDIYDSLGLGMVDSLGLDDSLGPEDSLQQESSPH